MLIFGSDTFLLTEKNQTYLSNNSTETRKPTEKYMSCKTYLPTSSYKQIVGKTYSQKTTVNY